MSCCGDDRGVPPSSKLENALRCKASMHEVGDGHHVAPQPAPSIDKRLGPERTQGIYDDVLARDLTQEGGGYGALFRKIDGVRNLRIAEHDAAAAALLVAEMDAPQVVRTNEKSAPFNLTAEIGVFVPGVKWQALIESDAVHRRIAISHVAADVAAIGNSLAQNSSLGRAGVAKTDHGLRIVEFDSGGSRTVRQHGACQASDIRPRLES